MTSLDDLIEQNPDHAFGVYVYDGQATRVILEVLAPGGAALTYRAHTLAAAVDMAAADLAPAPEPEPAAGAMDDMG